MKKTAQKVLATLADTFGTQLEICRSADTLRGHFYAKLHGVEIKNGGVLTSAWGCGKTGEAACKDLVSQYDGQLLVYRAYTTEMRREMYFVKG